jgi:hypothetical protein
MKKNIYPLILLVVIALAVSVSCEKKAQFDHFKDVPLILQNLKTYNESVTETAPRTKGFRRFCAIVGSDFIGACEGASKGAEIGSKVGALCGGHVAEGAIIGGSVMGLVCGAGASYIAHMSTSSASVACVSSQFLSYGQQVRQTSQEDSCAFAIDGLALPGSAIIVGSLHNEILDIVLNHDDDSEPASLPPDTDSDDDQPSISSLEESFFEFQETCDTCEATFERYENYGITLTVANIVGDVASSFLELLHNHTSSISSLMTYINDYYDIISASSELSDGEKNALYNGLAVAYFSYSYWEDDYE